MSGNGKSRLRRWLRALLVVLVLLAGLAVLLTFLIFSSPERFKPQQVAVDDTVVQAALAANLYRQVQNSTPGEVAELVLPPDQIDALINIALNGAAVYQAVDRGEHLLDEQDYTARYRDGMVEFRATIDTGESWLGGGAVVVSGRAMLTLARDSEEKLTVDEIRAGRLPLPGLVGEWAFDAMMDSVRETAEYREFRPVIIEISKLDDGSVKVVYLPY
ncbi:MAG: hypothetical protein AB7F40_07020, partial [Victivallaceae bacterium]